MRFQSAFVVISVICGLAACREIPLHDSRAVISLQQTLALYPLAIDSKNFAALDQVFAQHVVANYSAPLGVLNGLPTVISVLQASLAPVFSQHTLSTFAVTDLKEESASTVIYLTANHFGKGAYAGQIYSTYAQYVDKWTVIDGSWKVIQRQFNYMGPGSGNVSIFLG